MLQHGDVRRDRLLAGNTIVRAGFTYLSLTNRLWLVGQHIVFFRSVKVPYVDPAAAAAAGATAGALRHSYRRTGAGGAAGGTQVPARVGLILSSRTPGA